MTSRHMCKCALGHKPASCCAVTAVSAGMGSDVSIMSHEKQGLETDTWAQAHGGFLSVKGKQVTTPVKR